MSSSLSIRFNNAFNFSKPETPVIYIRYGGSEILALLDYVLLCLFCNIIKVKHLCILLPYLTCYSFLFSICYLYSFHLQMSQLILSFELKAIFSISLVKILCLSVLNPSCNFNSNFFMSSFLYFLRLLTLIPFFYK